MWKTKYLQFFLCALFFSIAGFIGGYILFGVPGNNISLKPGANQLTSIGQLSNSDLSLPVEEIYREIEGRSFYTLCGHWEPLDLGNLKGITSEKLLEKFPREQGWEIEDSGDKLIITKRINALCPMDEAKRHLGHFGEYVAVIKGPAGVDGGILEVTDIKLADLPANLRTQAEKGTLNFSSAQSLLEALDSMDEYFE